MRSETRTDSRMFGKVLRSLLKEGIAVRFRAAGRSMYPAIRDGDMVQVEAGTTSAAGETVMTETADGLRIHRIEKVGATVTTRGDCCLDRDLESYPVGAVSIISEEAASPVPRRRAGAVVRRWVAIWRGHF
jgi:hypothetical protein